MGSAEQLPRPPRAGAHGPSRAAERGRGSRDPAGSESARAAYARRLARHQQVGPALDRLTRLAATLLGTPSAQASIIAEAQVVLAGVGDAVAGTEGPAVDALCTMTVQTAAPIVVSDARADDRVAALPPVTSGRVGAYLGVPLRSGGQVVGALGVFGPEPRSWDEQDLAVLEQLATPMVSELELAELEEHYEDDRVVWQLAVDAAGVGVWDWKPKSDELRWDDRLHAIFGIDPADFGGTIAAFERGVHPDDRRRVQRTLEEAVATCGPFQSEYRVVHPDGTVRWVRARGQALAAADGKTDRVLGAAYDTTAVHLAEARVARVLDAMATAFCQLDPAGVVTYANRAAGHVLGLDPADLVGRAAPALFAAVRTELAEWLRDLPAGGEPVRLETPRPGGGEGWFELSAWPTPDGVSVHLIDITERRAAVARAAAATERTALLAEVTQALAGTLEGEEAVRRLARLVVPALGDWCVVSIVDGAVGLHRPGTVGSGWRSRLRDVGWWHADPEQRDLVARYAGRRLPALLDDSFVARALHGEPVVRVPRGAAAAVAAILAPGEASELLAQLDPDTGIIVQLRGRDRIVGILTLFRGQGRESFGEADVADVLDVAGRAGLALDNARLYGAQRELAEGLQRSLLTPPPPLAGYDVAARYAPAAEAARVGGDWYDAFDRPDGTAMVVVGDVVGHDTAAAAAMGQVRGMLRGIAVVTDGGPAEVLRHVDEAVARLGLDTSATAVVASLDRVAPDGPVRVRWANAGHPPPLLVVPGRAGAPPTVTVLGDPHPDLLLGYDPTTGRAEHQLELPSDGVLLLYTDGVVERRGHTIDEGIAELGQALAGLVADGLDPAGLCDELLRRVLGPDLDDDVALVAIRPTVGAGRPGRPGS